MAEPTAKLQKNQNTSEAAVAEQKAFYSRVLSSNPVGFGISSFWLQPFFNNVDFHWPDVEPVTF